MSPSGEIEPQAGLDRVGHSNIIARVAPREELSYQRNQLTLPRLRPFLRA